MPYPATTRCLSLSYCARFSGCAMAPTSCHAALRGSCVSVSRVITYFTLDRISVLPTMREKPFAGLLLTPSVVLPFTSPFPLSPPLKGGETLQPSPLEGEGEGEGGLFMISSISFLPRNKEFKAASFPRLRSYPIQIRSCGFHRRGRWKRKKASFVKLLYFSFSSSIRCRASSNSGPSSGSISP